MLDELSSLIYQAKGIRERKMELVCINFLYKFVNCTSINVEKNKTYKVHYYLAYEILKSHNLIILNQTLKVLCIV